MSEHSITIVRLDASTESMPALATAIATWLQGAKLIRPNPSPDRIHQPSVWLPGPSWREVVVTEPWLEVFEGTSNNGVDVKADRDFYHPVENDEPPSCSRCHAQMPEQTYFGYLEPWREYGEEPIVECPRCGQKAPAGDWVGEFSFLVGGPAVAFNNWPELKPEFVDDLRKRLAGRTAVVRAHW